MKTVKVDMVEIEVFLSEKTTKYLKHLSKKAKISISSIVQAFLVMELIQQAEKKEK